ncbi:MAG: ketosteroid isomerase family protein [Pegethrix bostrychoides GSE-TBD4-15B]|jgi:hypothetical protein|uniref:Ketosteroid isomerase family protein n=1 Tax=Pegethrix bostrychoides GSE-TBD4-15B TaxID=2839662 RepID=A0A951PB80_9CYAN|nr:ketosteroid isomerase family protein [Pegethrix bostrychoides GSE-TBD4-15B]
MKADIQSTSAHPTFPTSAHLLADPLAHSAYNQPSAYSQLTQRELAESHQSKAAKQQILAYFAALNTGDFLASAELFAEDGQLLPPFESAIVGQAAIAEYLKAEAKGMQAVVQSVDAQPLSETTQMMTQIQVIGQVQAPLFVVNVGWLFVVNERSEIVSLKIKLLAALKDLLHLKR